MTTTPALELMGLAVRYLKHEIGLQDLDEWLARHTTWTMTASKCDANDLAALIELTIAETSLGRATEDDLRREIHDFLISREMFLAVCDMGGRSTSSTYHVVESTWMVPLHRTVDIRLAMEFSTQ